MDTSRVKVLTRSLVPSFILIIALTCNVEAWNTLYSVHGSHQSFIAPDVVTLDHLRYRREAPSQPPVSTAPAATNPELPSSTTVNPLTAAITNSTIETNATILATDDSNRTTNLTEVYTRAPAVVTQIPLLGRNGTGILRVNLTNSPKVSDPILPDDNTSDVFTKTPELLKAEHNISKITYDNHVFYNSTFIGNTTFFNDHWANITKNKAEIHSVLSKSHRRASTMQLSFDFPFYGHYIRNVTVATGGFLYAGEHLHNWLAATQYIAPLMANFDTTLNDDSVIKESDDGDKFTVFWENVSLQEDPTKRFTFAATLYKNGDIVFAYKDIPIAVQAIKDSEHPVKVGISDAYLTDRIIFFVRRKTIYEYHRASFKYHDITNSTILKLTALPTCLQYDTCESCVGHDTAFNCSWCEQIQKCSSGTDRNKQDWMLRSCDKFPISNASSCPAATRVEPAPEHGSPAYVTDDRSPTNDTVIQMTKHSRVGVTKTNVEEPVVEPLAKSPAPAQASHSIGAAIAAFIALAVFAGAGWAFYAFRNPHTRSGQILIKYRPTQWTWRRGEARYTAATIHM